MSSIRVATLLKLFVANFSGRSVKKAERQPHLFRILVIHAFLPGRIYQYGLIPSRTYGNDIGLAADKLLQPSNIGLGFSGKVLEAADIGCRRLPSLQLLIDRLTLFQYFQTAGKTVKDITVQFVSCADADGGKAIEDIQASQGKTGEAID